MYVSWITGTTGVIGFDKNKIDMFGAVLTVVINRVVVLNIVDNIVDDVNVLVTLPVATRIGVTVGVREIVVVNVDDVFVAGTIRAAVPVVG
jgi:hypothetical protein